MNEWSKERITRLKELHAKGYSCSEIAADLGGVSRSAIIGKLHRLDRRYVNRTRLRTKEQTLADNRLKMRSKRRPAMPPPINAEPFTPRRDVVVPESKLLSLMKLTELTCKWPAGDMPPFTYCGHDAEEGLPYCEGHCVIAYPNFVPRRRARAA